MVKLSDGPGWNRAQGGVPPEMRNNSLPRPDSSPAVKERLLPYCRLTLTLALMLAFIACETDAQRIRATNEAATSPDIEDNHISSEIGAMEVQDGDCINSTLLEGTVIESVVIVPCTGAWHFRVLSSFNVAGFQRYPGEDHFRRQAYEKCDRRYTFLLFPVAESWEFGERTVNCLQDSFGLSITDPAKLDRLAKSDSLMLGDCFNKAPETRDLLAELVDCSGSWEFQVTDKFSVPAEGAYPGAHYFKLQAEQNCDSPPYIFFYPTTETWDWGNREVICSIAKS